MSRRIGWPDVRVWLGVVLLALALLWEGGTARAADHIVISNSGDDTTTGSLRQVVSAATSTSGNTIIFAPDVSRIPLKAAAASNTDNLTLTITGKKNSLDDEIKKLLLGYGIDVIHNTVDFTDVQVDPDTFPDLLKAAIAGLPKPIPVVTADETYKNHRLLEFTGTDGTITLTGLALRDARKVEKGTDETKTDASANASMPLSSTSTVTQGGALYIVGTGMLDTVTLAGSLLEVIAGEAKAGTVNNSSGSATAQATATANAYGGGVYFYGSDSTITNSLFQGNTAQATGGKATGGNATATAASSGSVTANANAYGGGVYFYGSDSTITNSLFQGNTAWAKGGTATGGKAVSSSGSSIANANTSVNAVAYGGGAYFGGGGEITNSLFQENTAWAKGGTVTGGEATHNAWNPAYSYAYGGGVYFGGNGEITNSLFQGNTAQAMGNTARSTGGEATLSVATSSAAFASGGGAYFNGSNNTITSSLFQGNTAQAEAGTAKGGKATNSVVDGVADAFARDHASASGGGAYFNGSGTLTNSLFQGNSAQATGGILAQGGTGVATWANADAYAFGGAVYFAGGFVSTPSSGDPFFVAGDATIDGGSFIGNHVTAEAKGKVFQGGKKYTPEAEARGGAIFVNTSKPASATTAALLPSTLTLKADAGEIVISGNTATANGVTVANGIHFGRGGALPNATGYFPDSKTGTTFDVIATNHDILLLDPVTVELYNADGDADFAMTVQSGDHTFTWGGKNVFDANGGASVTFESGSTTVFQDDFTLGTTKDIDYRTGSPTDAYARASTTDPNPTGNTNALKVTLESGADLAFSYTRNREQALFDFTDSTSNEQLGNFDVGEGASMSMMNRPRQLLSAPGARYLVADGIADSATAIANLIAGTGIDGFESVSNQVWAVIDAYASPHQPEIDGWKNTQSAASSLQDLLRDERAVSQEAFDAVVSNLASATPDHVLNQAVASLRLSGLVLDMARNDAFADVERANGARLWGRFLGNALDRVDSHGRYRGYRQDANGFLLGLDHDTGSTRAGAYIGYTRGETRTRSGANSEVETEGFHAGLLGKIAPLEDVPHFALTGEAGFSRYANEARRDAGAGRIRADFEQRVHSVGVGAEYRLEAGTAQLTPFVRFRHTRLEQEGVDERGGLTRTRIGDVSEDSLTSELGARLSKTFIAPRGAVTPYASVSWRHESGDVGFSAMARYGLPDGTLPEFGVGSVHRDRDTARIGAGIRASLGLAEGRRLGINADYKAGIDQNGISHAFSVLLEFAF